MAKGKDAAGTGNYSRAELDKKRQERKDSEKSSRDATHKTPTPTLPVMTEDKAGTATDTATQLHTEQAEQKDSDKSSPRATPKKPNPTPPVVIPNVADKAETATHPPTEPDTEQAGREATPKKLNPILLALGAFTALLGNFFTLIFAGYRYFSLSKQRKQEAKLLDKSKTEPTTQEPVINIITPGNFWLFCASYGTRGLPQYTTIPTAETKSKPSESPSQPNAAL